MSAFFCLQKVVGAFVSGICFWAHLRQKKLPPFGLFLKLVLQGRVCSFF